MTTKIYPSIAIKYHKKIVCIERNIRTAIEIAFSTRRGNYEFKDELFGSSIDYEKGKPTNTEFIITIANKVILDLDLY